MTTFGDDLIKNENIKEDFIAGMLSYGDFKACYDIKLAS